MIKRERVSLPDTIGGGYGKFWRFKGRYLVCKGSRGSKKSTTAAMKMIHLIMKYPLSNGLVIRKYETLHRQSTFAQLKWAIRRLKVEHLWRASLSPMTLTYIPTGQIILFRGLDNAESLTSLTVEIGIICFVWVEEAYQIENEDDFNKLALSIRGTTEGNLFKQFILTFNPWSSQTWIKERFFDSGDPNCLAMTTNYMCNEFLDAQDMLVFEYMKENYPQRYLVEGLGDWGIADGLIFENWEEMLFDYNLLAREVDVTGKFVYEHRYGLDFGFAEDPTAFIAVLASQERGEIYIYDEVYLPKATNSEIRNALAHKGYDKVRIISDRQDSRTINELFLIGVENIDKADKGSDSVRAGIRKLQDYKIYVHPNCAEAIIELKNYAWAKDKTGKPLNRPAENGFDHLMDALRYACESLGARKFSFFN